MKRILILLFFQLSFHGMTQVYLDTTADMSAKRVQFADIQQFAIGSYGEAHYNQNIDGDEFRAGKIDLHRIITYLGYRFNERVQFFSEIEFEHTVELTVEQAFVNYRFNDKFNLKTGLILVPMGYVNEFHEPTLFNGVERPNVDKYIIPSTWREMGAGFQGLFKKSSIKYQLYLLNGFNGYTGAARLSGANGIRNARQGGDESTFLRPSLTGKVSYFGFNKLLIEASAYIGKTESSLYNGLDRNNTAAISQADSTVVGISMVGLNTSYAAKNFLFRGQAIYTSISNTDQYNAFTGSNVANGILGGYAELSYKADLKKDDYLQLIPFVRYEYYDTHFKVDDNISRNKAYAREEVLIGVGLKPAPGIIFKADYQLTRTKLNDEFMSTINLGFGYWF
ncbi:MAG: hypothetical protein EP305_09140 [Bacteroidetes bacterium]|nr:MAG: hypothetical protein EP305_09140 [Bacteroidota bacterium]